MSRDQDQLEGRNIVIEAMVRKKRKIHRVFMDQGVQPDRMRMAAHGSLQPAASNSSGAGRARNRRVEFRLVEQAFIELD